MGESVRVSRLRNIALIFVFWIYAVLLFVGVKSLSHHLLMGWAARLGTMIGLAAGLAPWSHWLRPRITWTLTAIGHAVFIGCYLILLAPFALVAKAMRDVLRQRRPTTDSLWIPRAPMLQTLDEARQES